jgi:hypothetical protein
MLHQYLFLLIDDQNGRSHTDYRTVANHFSKTRYVTHQTPPFSIAYITEDDYADNIQKANDKYSDN